MFFSSLREASALTTFDLTSLDDEDSKCRQCFCRAREDRDYLLNAAHPDNGGKAAFFMALGFQTEDWPALAAGRREIARNTEVAETFESIHGRKYTLTGCLQSPSGRLPVVQTIWIIDRGEEIPRLVTAYPHEE